MWLPLISRGLLALAFVFALLMPSASARQSLPNGPLAMRAFTLRFDPAGTFTLDGPGWPSMSGTWTMSGREMTLQLQNGPNDCSGPGRYALTVDATRVSFSVISDECVPRRMILDRSEWLPPDVKPAVPPRRITRAPGTAKGPLPARAPGTGHWPAFRGHEATGVADGQKLPDAWNPAAGQNIVWRTPIPGLAHSSPIVWGDTVFVTTAISGRGQATFKPGLYGDGDAADDRSPHRWVVYAIDKRTGKIRWERTAAQGEPRNKRHIKSTYASSSPATDGRIVVAWFGSQGIYAYDFNGDLRWSVDLGRVDMGAYDIPAYEWGPASSPIIWNGLVIVQCDTQADSFLLALSADTGEIVWKTDREELPSWGTPTVVTTDAGPELITNASNHIRGYDPRTGRELWRLGGSSKISADADLRERPAHCRERPRTRTADLCGAPGRARRSHAPPRRDREPACRVEQDRPRLVHAHASRLSRHSLRARQQRRVRRVRHRDWQGDLSSAPAGGGQRLQRVTGGGRREDLPLGRRRRAARDRGRADLQAHRHQLDG